MLGAPTACGSLALNVSISTSSPVETSSDEANRFMEASLSLSLAELTIDPRSVAEQVGAGDEARRLAI